MLQKKSLREKKISSQKSLLLPKKGIQSKSRRLENDYVALILAIFYFFFFCPYILVTLKLPILSKVIAYSAIGNTRDPLVPLDSLDLSYANFSLYTASFVGLLDLTLGIAIKMASCC